MRQSIVEGGRRPDGRRVDETRLLTGEVRIVHGSVTGRGGDQARNVGVV